MPRGGKKQEEFRNRPPKPTAQDSRRRQSLFLLCFIESTRENGGEEGEHCGRSATAPFAWCERETEPPPPPMIPVMRRMICVSLPSAELVWARSRRPRICKKIK